jgi:hypothetical protein
MEREPIGSGSGGKSPQRWVAALERVKTQQQAPKSQSEPGVNNELE